MHHLDDQQKLAALEAQVAALKANQPQQKSNGCLGITLGLVGLLVVACVVQMGSGSDLPRQTPQESADTTLIVATKIALEKGLRDPKSAQYGVVAVSHKTGKAVVCGYVNARNGFGGMTGERPFLMADNKVMLADGKVTANFRRIWNANCG